MRERGDDSLSEYIIITMTTKAASRAYFRHDAFLDPIQHRVARCHSRHGRHISGKFWPVWGMAAAGIRFRVSSPHTLLSCLGGLGQQFLPSMFSHCHCIPRVAKPSSDTQHLFLSDYLTFIIIKVEVAQCDGVCSP